MLTNLLNISLNQDTKLNEFIIDSLKDVISFYVSENVDFEFDDDLYIDGLFAEYSKYLLKVLYPIYKDKLTNLYHFILKK
jgi:hypothetical protein